MSQSAQWSPQACFSLSHMQPSYTLFVYVNVQHLHILLLRYCLIVFADITFSPVSAEIYCTRVCC